MKNDLPGPGTNDVDTVFLVFKQIQMHETDIQLWLSEDRGAGKGASLFLPQGRGVIFFLTISVITSVSTLSFESTFWGDFLEDRFPVLFSKSLSRRDLLMTRRARLFKLEE